MSINRAIEPAINLIESVVLPKVDVVTLDNGVQAHVINAGEQEVVKIELLFKAGKWFETKNLVSDFTNRMLREGTERRTGKEIADIFDYHGANVNYASAYETAGAVMYSLSHKAEILIPLLHEVFTEAIFPANEYDTIANNRKQRLKVDLEKNDFVANRTFVDALYGQQHPYGRVTKFEDFDTMSPADLRNFYKQYYNPANLTIIVSGQVKDSLLKELNKYFGSTSWKG
ncbi:MAG: insulinase family protein [Bacteroidetes bacterium]|nr:insulinase family protein [Bacteroidota bacterium]